MSILCYVLVRKRDLTVWSVFNRNSNKGGFEAKKETEETPERDEL